jgi:hypothetical protein
VTEQQPDQAGTDEARGKTAQEPGPVEEAARLGRRRGRPCRVRSDCVMLRSIGRAVFGAVVVVGGAVLVFEPRLPKLTRERASASTATTASTAAMAQSASSTRKRNMRMDGLPEARLGSIRPL